MKTTLPIATALFCLFLGACDAQQEVAPKVNSTSPAPGLTVVYGETTQTQNVTSGDADCKMFLNQSMIYMDLDFQNLPTDQGKLTFNLSIVIPGTDIINPAPMVQLGLVSQCRKITAHIDTIIPIAQNTLNDENGAVVVLQIEATLHGTCGASSRVGGGLSVILETMDPKTVVQAQICDLQINYQHKEQPYPSTVTAIHPSSCPS